MFFETLRKKMVSMFGIKEAPAEKQEEVKAEPKLKADPIPTPKVNKVSLPSKKPVEAPAKKKAIAGVLSDPEMEKAIVEYRKAHPEASNREVASKVGCSDPTAKKALLANGFECRTYNMKKNQHPNDEKLSDEDVAFHYLKHLELTDFYALATTLGISSNKAFRILKKYDLNGREDKSQALDDKARKLIVKYKKDINPKARQQDIATRFQCSAATINKILGRAGLTRTYKG